MNPIRRLLIIFDSALPPSQAMRLLAVFTTDESVKIFTSTNRRRASFESKCGTMGPKRQRAITMPTVNKRKFFLISAFRKSIRAAVKKTEKYLELLNV